MFVIFAIKFVKKFDFEMIRFVKIFVNNSITYIDSNLKFKTSLFVKDKILRIITKKNDYKKFQLVKLSKNVYLFSVSMTVKPKVFESMKPRPILCFFVSSVLKQNQILSRKRRKLKLSKKVLSSSFEKNKVY